MPDDLILRLVEERLAQPDAAAGSSWTGFRGRFRRRRGWIGCWPRPGAALDAVIKIDVGKKELLERLTSRRICPGCAAVYNLLAQPPAEDGVCDRCGTNLVQRDDDTEATVRRRLQVYASSTAPLIDWYDARRLLVHRPRRGAGRVGLPTGSSAAIGERTEPGRDTGAGDAAGLST